MQRKNDSHVISAYESLRERIIMYALPPKTPLSDYRLAEELSMSRAPVREAILLLERDGLVTINENGKKIVSPITLADVTDILHVRSALESEALRMIADSGWLSPAHVTQIRQIHEKMLRAARDGKVRDCYLYDDEFHYTFVSCAGSPRITETLERMRLQMQRARWLNVASPSRQTATCREHEAILTALLDQKLTPCIRALRTHFANSEKAFSLTLRDQEMQTIASMISTFYEEAG